jgi:cold shock CspA family protein
MKKTAQAVVIWTQVATSEDGTRILFSRPLGKKTAYVEDRLSVDDMPPCTFVHGTSKKEALERFNNPRFDLPFMLPAKAIVKKDVKVKGKSGGIPIASDYTEATVGIGETYTGKIKFFNLEKGYGFLGLDGYADVFLHINCVPEGLEDQLTIGTKFNFTVVKGEKGDRLMACVNTLATIAEGLRKAA